VDAAVHEQTSRIFSRLARLRVSGSLFCPERSGRGQIPAPIHQRRPTLARTPRDKMPAALPPKAHSPPAAPPSHSAITIFTSAPAARCPRFSLSRSRTFLDCRRNSHGKRQRFQRNLQHRMPWPLSRSRRRRLQGTSETKPGSDLFQDSGATWHLAAQQPGGYRSAVAFLSGRRCVAVGTNGSDISNDAGVHWRHLDTFNLNAIGVRAGASCALAQKDGSAGQPAIAVALEEMFIALQSTPTPRILPTAR